MQTLTQQFSINFSFPVYFCRNIFQAKNSLLATVLKDGGEARHKVLCLVDTGVLAGYPSLPTHIEAYAETYRNDMQLCGPILFVEGGERCKTEPVILDKIMDCIREHHLCRHSYILVIGGGAVLDVVGYGAAIAHRGLRLIRMPTTVLAQNDAGIGVKNGINALGRKNFIGTFAPPTAVINDFSFLDTLPSGELRAGMAEAVKVALIKDQSFFLSLYEQRSVLAAFSMPAIEEMIYRCADLHMQHIGRGGDPFELGSARPLDFGHWSAHKLEETTGGLLKHGEAVAVGMALDSLYSCLSGRIKESELQQILTLIDELGLPVYHPALAEIDIDRALGEFREHLGGKMAITLLTGIGRKEEVDYIDISLMERCINELMRYNDSRQTGTELTGKTTFLGESH